MANVSYRRELAGEIRGAFQDPRALVAALGLSEKSRRQAGGGITILCPAHGERSPSCSVTRGPDGTVRVRCFGCDFAGNALHLIAAARGLEMRGQFREVLEQACEVGGLWRELDELRGAAPAEPRPVAARRPAPPLPPERTYPPREEVDALWEAASGVGGADERVAAELRRRGLEPADVDDLDLARALPAGRLPAWAKYQRASWRETGHWLLVRSFDEDGIARSLRAWRVAPGDTPKRLPPGGHKAAELVLANPPAVRLLSGAAPTSRLVITEGEPDWLVWSVKRPTLPIIGIGSGSWTRGFALKVPYGSEVIIRTHADKAGFRYAQRVLEDCQERARVRVIREIAEDAA